MEHDGNEFNLSKRNVKNIFHEHSDRVSDDAVLRAIQNEETRIHKIARLSKQMAKHRGRETVTEDDVRMVLTMEAEFNG